MFSKHGFSKHLSKKPVILNGCTVTDQCIFMGKVLIKMIESGLISTPKPMTKQNNSEHSFASLHHIEDSNVG